jgi:hypothetical protein
MASDTRQILRKLATLSLFGLNPAVIWLIKRYQRSRRYPWGGGAYWGDQTIGGMRRSLRRREPYAFSNETCMGLRIDQGRRAVGLRCWESVSDGDARGDATAIHRGIAFPEQSRSRGGSGIARRLHANARASYPCAAAVHSHIHMASEPIVQSLASRFPSRPAWRSIVRNDDRALRDVCVFTFVRLEFLSDR